MLCYLYLCVVLIPVIITSSGCVMSLMRMSYIMLSLFRFLFCKFDHKSPLNHHCRPLYIVTCMVCLLCRKHLIAKKNMTTWMNAIALILTALPEPYWKNIFHQIVNEFKNSSFLSGVDLSSTNPFEVCSFLGPVHPWPFCIGFLCLMTLSYDAL